MEAKSVSGALGSGAYAVTCAIVAVAALCLWLCRPWPTAGPPLLPAWVPLEIGISSALLRSNGLASRLPSVCALLPSPRQCR